MPLVLAGGLGGTLKTGRSLDYLNAGNDKRQAVQPVPFAHGPHGPELPEFGDAKERLAGI